MMMGLGMFVFSLPTLAYQELQRQTAWRHPSNSRVRARPGRQFLGPGDDTMTLQGLLLPELMGSRQSLRELRQMADDGQAYPLVNGAGEVFGAWVIESLSETGSMFVNDGRPRRIEFALQLARVDDNKVDAMGSLA